MKIFLNSFIDRMESKWEFIMKELAHVKSLTKKKQKVQRNKDNRQADQIERQFIERKMK